MYKNGINLLLLLFPLLLGAQSRRQQAVEKAVEQLRVAMIQSDAAVLSRLTSQRLSYGHSSGAVDDQQQFVQKLVSGQSDFVDIELKGQQVSVSGKTAIVRHLLSAKTNDGGKPGEVHLQILLVWQKQGGHWKLLARQAVKRT